MFCFVALVSFRACVAISFSVFVLGPFWDNFWDCVGIDLVLFWDDFLIVLGPFWYRFGIVFETVF